MGCNSSSSPVLGDSETTGVCSRRRSSDDSRWGDVSLIGFRGTLVVGMNGNVVISRDFFEDKERKERFRKGPDGGG